MHTHGRQADLHALIEAGESGRVLLGQVGELLVEEGLPGRRGLEHHRREQARKVRQVLLMELARQARRRLGEHLESGRLLSCIALRS